MDNSQLCVTTSPYDSLTDLPVWQSTSTRNKQEGSIKIPDNPETLVLYALNDNADAFFHNTDNQIRLLERKIVAVPVTSFLIVTEARVRPEQVETLASAVNILGLEISETDINELRKAKHSYEELYHSGLNLFTKHSKWAEIKHYVEVLSTRLSTWDKCNRIVVMLHGNADDDDSFTTTCFSNGEYWICLRQNIKTLAESIGSFINSRNKEEFTCEKVVSIDFGTCSNFISEKLYRKFAQSLNSVELVGDNRNRFKIGYFPSWRRLLTNDYDILSSERIGASWFCFSDIEYLEHIEWHHFVSTFAYPYHSRNNNALGFYNGESDFLIKNKISCYVGQCDFLENFIISTAKNSYFRILGDDKKSLFSFWCNLIKMPDNIQNWLDYARGEWGGVQNVLRFRDNNGRTLLSHLVTVKNDIVPGLIKQIIPLDPWEEQSDSDGRNLIFWSANNGCFENTVQLLESLKKQGEYNTDQIQTIINKRNSRGMPPIGKAIFYGHIDVIKLLLGEKSCLDWQDADGHTPLILACMSGQQDVVELLLASEQITQQINQQDNAGLTPLHYAFETRLPLAVVSRLLDKGADLSIKGGEYGNTPLLTACNFYADFAGMLNNLRQENHLAEALQRYNKCGWWPLGYACYLQKNVLVSQLLEVGAGLSEYNYNGTALEIACRAGDSVSLAYLLKQANEPDLQCTNNDGWQPLYHLILDSASPEMESMLRMLLNKGCNPANTDRNGNTALLYAIVSKSEAASDILLQDQCVKDTVDHVNIFGNTALHGAVANGYESLVERLVESGANIAKSNNYGRTVLHFCAIHDSFACLQAILSHYSSLAPAEKTLPAEKSLKVERTLSLVNNEKLRLSQLEQSLRCKDCYGFTPLNYVKGGKMRKMLQDAAVGLDSEPGKNILQST